MNFGDAGRFIPRSPLYPGQDQGNGMNPGGPMMGGMGGDPRAALIQQASQGYAHPTQGQSYLAQPAPDDLQMLRGLPQQPQISMPMQPAVDNAFQHSMELQKLRQLIQANESPDNMTYRPQIGKAGQVEAIRRLAAMLAQQYHGTKRQYAGPSGGRLVQ